MYQSIPITFTTKSFLLESNRIKIGANRLFIFLGIVLYPTLFINSIFYSVLDIQGDNLLFATGGILLIFMNVAIFLWRKNQPVNRKLLIGFEDIKVFEDGKLMQTIHFTQLKVTALQHGFEEENALPALRIQDQNELSITIGSTTSIPYFFKASETVDYTDFIIKSEQEWKMLWDNLKNIVASEQPELMTTN